MIITDDIIADIKIALAPVLLIISRVKSRCDHYCYLNYTRNNIKPLKIYIFISEMI